MEISRTLRDDLSKKFEFITTDQSPKLPTKRLRSCSPTPRLKSSSSSVQLEKLKMSLDIDARQKKVEEFKRKLEEKKNFMIKSSIEMEGKFKQNISEPQKKKVQQNCMNKGGIESQVELKNAGNHMKVIVGNGKDNQDFKDFKREINRDDDKRMRIKGLRDEFPREILEEYPFFGSPDRNDDTASIIKLVDANCGRAEVMEAINRMANY
ncbi:hypothetical protein SteCoe_5265 [Stentor coeruleus]|uniref:Uncharacterized protein n=1 Tax=Stentor coeruleus TaxID=5963 RepID=A0A1R2CSW4_9CILI|nr:hypothetical protein SteCoe_5265 [Stentor coeruleus]